MRARPELMDLSDIEEESTPRNQKGKSSKQKQTKKYVPPKLVPMPYTGDQREKEERKLERARKRALQSNLVKELRSQYGEAPEEVVDQFSTAKMSRAFEEKQKYEERNYTRLKTTKEEMNEIKRKRQMNVLDELLSFGDYLPEGSKKSHGVSSKKGAKGKFQRKSKKKWRNFRKG
uniref:Neuroguidin n=1 Tax=Acrobeloides nanus TaxID=290746 RepID=A0A914EIH8_9BILA